VRGFRVGVTTLLLCSCIGSGRAGAQAAAAGVDLPPAGYGTLRQDDLSVSLQSGDVEVRLLPLDERLLRLIAKDGYESLHGLVASRQGQIDSAIREAGLGSPSLALVSFFALREGARFDPQNVNLWYHNQLFRPAATLPITANFTSRQLPVHRQASAIYLFDMTLPIFEQFDVVYASSQSSGWRDVLPRIQRERGRVMSRWQAEQGDTTTGKPKVTPER
jgi:hypothetical protein